MTVVLDLSLEESRAARFCAVAIAFADETLDEASTALPSVLRISRRVVVRT